MNDPVLRGAEWSRLWDGDPILGDGLKIAFEKIKQAYFERAGLIEPWEGDKLGKLALARRIVDMVEGHVHSVISDGLIEDANRAQADKIANLPERKKRLLDF